MELLDMTCDQVNLEEQYFKGGSKSDSGKNRIVQFILVSCRL